MVAVKPAGFADPVIVITEVSIAGENYLADLAAEAAMKKIQKKVGLSVSDDDMGAAISGLEKLPGLD